MENFYLGNGKRWTINTETSFTGINDSKNKEIPGIIRKLLAQRGLINQRDIESFCGRPLRIYMTLFA